MPLYSSMFTSRKRVAGTRRGFSKLTQVGIVLVVLAVILLFWIWGRRHTHIATEALLGISALVTGVAVIVMAYRLKDNKILAITGMVLCAIWPILVVTHSVSRASKQAESLVAEVVKISNRRVQTGQANSMRQLVISCDFTSADGALRAEGAIKDLAKGETKQDQDNLETCLKKVRLRNDSVRIVRDSLVLVRKLENQLQLTANELATARATMNANALTKKTRDSLRAVIGSLTASKNKLLADQANLNSEINKLRQENLTLHSSQKAAVDVNAALANQRTQLTAEKVAAVNAVTRKIPQLVAAAAAAQARHDSLYISATRVQAPSVTVNNVVPTPTVVVAPPPAAQPAPAEKEVAKAAPAAPKHEAKAEVAKAKRPAATKPRPVKKTATKDFCKDLKPDLRAMFQACNK